MNDIMVTICCLSFNHEKYIRKALEGIVSQKTNFKFIALVHDDASTDGSADIIREYAEKYPDIIKPIIQTENQYSKGLSVTKNVLIPKVETKYTAYCECDDYWCDEYKLQKQFDIMENNPNLSMCVHKVQCIDEGGTPIEQVLPSKDYGITKTGLISRDEYADLLFLKGGYPFHTSSYFHKTENVHSDFFEKFDAKVNGDQRISFSALCYGDVYYFDEVMSCRRMMTPGSYNDRLRKKSAEEVFAIRANSLKACIQFDHLSDGVFNKKIVESVYNRLYNYLFSFDTKMVFDCFKKISKDYKFRRDVSLALSMRYVAMKYFPSLLSLYVKLRIKK